MTNKTKKLLSILASNAILAGFTADVTLNSNPTTVNAAKHHKKKSTKKTQKKHAKKKTAKHKQNTNSGNSSSNSNTNSSTTNSTSNSAYSSNDNTIEPQSKYSSLADWYAANGLKVYNKYHNQSVNDDSQEFNNGYSDGVFGVINHPTDYNNEPYKEGQILGMTFNDVDPSAAVTSLPAQEGLTLSQLFQKSIDSYNAAGDYIKANPSVQYIQQIGTNQWGPNQ